LFLPRQEEVLFLPRQEEVLFLPRQEEVLFLPRQEEVLEVRLYSLSDLGLGRSHCLWQSDCRLLLYRQQDYWFHRRHRRHYPVRRHLDPRFRRRKNNVSTNPEHIEYGLGLLDWNPHLHLAPHRHHPHRCRRHHLQW
jgi:hypothetical protein